ncbi:MupA/Atu3671 family FMN-dependent luciferase-like monooxygenase [Paenibacillus sp. GbtcB18]|uniref:MupA/Atu3671 family FMN-dependent luciferase-like monooxygenase n=1 Tax=Paenibacillus sp. GbtcB18 TaxID=2824763 RepID=UPI001C303589|nr:MupA/Atu3671 family FMN-dependent luciferase-like monooxygenase [Paenibacillus sp. GbtcB18]
MDFSIFFFSSYKQSAADKYKLLKDSAQFGDRNGFSAIWTPERHFHEFGGLFPNPSVLSAGLAMITERIQIRSGSIVSPLHHVARIVEDWSVVDNLSAGRVELSFAPGWHSDDFIFHPERFDQRTTFMFDQIEQARRLWRGESEVFTNGSDKQVEIRTYPRPIQEELSVWVSTNGSVDTIQRAGEMGANLLTNFIGQDIHELNRKLAIYRKALHDNGYSPDSRKVSVMLHTYLGKDIEQVKRVAKQPFKDYLSTSMSLIKQVYETKKISNPELEKQLKNPLVFEKFLEIAYSRYWNTAALLGTVDSCSELVRNLQQIGVNEIACLIDFGIEDELIIRGLDTLLELKEKFHS